MKECESNMQELRKKRVLLINHYAGSPSMGMEFRPYYLAKEWTKRGYIVDIVAADYSHLRMNNPLISRDFETQNIEGIRYHWLHTGVYVGNGIKRALTMFQFVGKLWINAKRIAHTYKPDVIITSSTYPLDTYAGQRIKKFCKGKVRLIHEVHDMWPITLIELGGMSRANPFVILMQMAENSFCKKSDYVVSLACAAKDYFIKHGMSAKKFRSIMNGVVLEEWDTPEPLPHEHQEILTQLHAREKFIICFFGSITKSYAIDYLLDAAKVVNDHRLAIVIVGEGNQKEELLIKSKAMKDVYFLPKISKRAIPTLLSEIDCSYVGALRNDMFRFGICMNKLFDSMMSGKPILYAVEAPNNFVEEYSCGVSVDAENVEALANGIRKILNLTKKEKEQMGNNGKKAVIQNYSYGNLAQQFAELF